MNDALAGTDRMNARFVTPLDIAVPVGPPLLVAPGIDRSKEGRDPALILRSLLGCRSKAAASALSPG